MSYTLILTEERLVYIVRVPMTQLEILYRLPQIFLRDMHILDASRKLHILYAIFHFPFLLTFLSI